jgi:type II secretory pathway pseudopilin PulG
MKQKDILVIIAVAILGVIAALILSNFVIASPKSKQIEVEQVDAISAEFKNPNDKYFNGEAINPSQLIRVNGERDTLDPFN